jgi:hypothetical protein
MTSWHPRARQNLAYGEVVFKIERRLSEKSIRKYPSCKLLPGMDFEIPPAGFEPATDGLENRDGVSGIASVSVRFFAAHRDSTQLHRDVSRVVFAVYE